jgi:rfaE bifunctional protein nucleotidyltransferase chain/domain
MKNKIIDLTELTNRSHELCASGKKLVATNGCFDLLHVGHIRYLQSARDLGDVLVVGLNDDPSVRELKGAGRPLNSARDRAEVLAALASVDWVTIFPGARATEFISAANPAVYVKGGDYKVETLNPEERETLEKMGTEIRIISFEEGYSTSKLIEQLKKTDA